MNTGDRIRNLRELGNYTQKELADRIGLNHSVLSRIESGERPIRDDELKNTAKILGVSADYLLGLTDIKNPYEIKTIAAHHDGEDWTEEELDDIEKFKEFVRIKRGNK